MICARIDGGERPLTSLDGACALQLAVGRAVKLEL